MTARPGSGAERERQSFRELDLIIKDTLLAVERGKEQIYLIAESARAEYDRVRAETALAKEEAVQLVREVDALELKERLARRRLAQVTKNFHDFSEDEIKEAYDTAREFQVQLQVAREKERHLRRRRDDLEIRLRQLDETVQRAEDLVTQVGVAMDFLSGRLRTLSEQFEGLKLKQELGLHIIRAQEEERRRVAREIHDGPAQLLASVVLRVDLCQRLLDVDSGRIRAELEGLKELVRQSLKDVRQVIFDLRPMALDDLGLVPALRAFLKGFEEKAGIAVHTSFLGDERRLEPSLEIATFRLIQEATNNIARHSGATQAWVRVEIASSAIRATVRDDGRGFDLEAALADRGAGRFGLVSMRERVELLEGRLDIATAPDQGTRIDVAIPIRGNEGAGARATHQDTDSR